MPSVSPEGVASGVPLDETMVMVSFAQVVIEPLTLLMVAEAALMLTLPKSAKGRTPDREEGASQIHSADWR